MKPILRILIADDSPTSRAFLRAVLSSDPEVMVIGEARSGEEAVELTRSLGPDLVTMDVNMTGMDGFEATKRIMTERPTPIVMVSRSVDIRDVGVALGATKVGAVSLLAPPDGPSSPHFEEQCAQFIRTLKAMSEVKLVRHWAERERAGPVAQRAPDRPTRTPAIAIAASTGGPAALQRILADLPGDLPAPLLVVQHIAPGFVEGLAVWLGAATSLRVKVARGGEPARPGVVFLAPDDRHLGLSPEGLVILSASAPIKGFRPSATFLFESVASARESATIAVVLTGMGRDGIDGLQAVRQRGGRILVQDEATAVVFGMPGSAIAEGLADAVLPVGGIAAEILNSVASLERSVSQNR